MNLEVRDLGCISYHEAYEIQKACVQKVILGAQSFPVFLCEHPPVLTMGRMAKESNILYPKEYLKDKGVDLIYIDRGGDITLHAPGQLVVYPIFDLNKLGRDLHIFLHRLEQVAIDLLTDFAIVAQRNPGRTGVWVGPQKIVSIGIGVKKWVSYHGIGINVNTDLKLFSLIRPCGMDVSMTSMKEILNQTVDMNLVKQKLIEKLTKEFSLDSTSPNTPHFTGEDEGESRTLRSSNTEALERSRVGHAAS